MPMAPAALIGLALIAMVLIWTSVGSGRAVDEQPLRVALGPWPGFDVVALGDEAGLGGDEGGTIFEHHGVSVRLFRFSNQFDATRAVGRGHVDMAFTSVSDLVLNPAAGDDLAIVLITNVSDGSDGLVVSADIGSLAELAGKTVGAERGTVNELIVAEALRRADRRLGLGDVELRAGTNTEVAAWFERGEIAAAALWEPELTEVAERTGGRVLYRTDAADTVVIDCLVARRSVLRERPDDVGRFVASWFAIMKAIEHDRTGALSAVAAGIGEDPAVFASAFGGLRPGTAAENRALMVEGGLSWRLEELRSVLEEMGFDVPQGVFAVDAVFVADAVGGGERVVGVPR